ncbi:MAG: hypothetical protein ACK4YP_00025 [Myxococcota bacterium]
MEIDGALTEVPPCDLPAPPALAAALAEGLVVPWRVADRLLPAAKLERAIVRRVEVRAGRVAVCDGRVIVADPSFRVVGRRGMPVEVVAASALRPSFVVAVGPEDLAVAPPDGAWRVTRRDTFVAHGAWDLGATARRGRARASSPRPR